MNTANPIILIPSKQGKARQHACMKQVKCGFETTRAVVPKIIQIDAIETNDNCPLGGRCFSLVLILPTLVNTNSQALVQMNAVYITLNEYGF